MRVLGLCGSLRRDSYNQRLLDAAAKELLGAAFFRVFDEIADIPPFNEDTEAHETPAAVQALRNAIEAASGIVIATPEYNASVPGLLKNAIDWASRPYPDHVLRGKRVIVVGASTSAFGAALAQAELRRILKAVGADVLDEELPVPQAHEAFAADGGLVDPRLRSQLTRMVQNLMSVAVDAEDVTSQGLPQVVQRLPEQQVFVTSGMVLHSRDNLKAMPGVKRGRLKTERH
jgi:chromate reductase